MIYAFENLTFQILTVDTFHHRKGFYKVAGRPYASLTFRTKGEGAFKVGEASFISKVGDIMFIPQFTPYEVDYSDGESVVFHLTDCNYFSPENITVKHKTAYKLLFTQALEEWSNRFCVHYLKSIVYKILQALEDEALEPAEQNKDGVFLSCVAYIKENFCNPNLSLTTLCKAFFISAAGLRRKFRRYLNTTFKEYLLRLRFNKALSLLSEGNYLVKDVAELCGFSDEKYFSRAIKKRFGLPPSAFLR